MKILISFFLVFLLFSCEISEKVDLNSNLKKLLVVNSLAKNEEKIVVQVSSSRNSDGNVLGKIDPNSTVVKLFEGEKLLEILKYNETKNNIHFFSSNDSLKIGKSYSIMVEADNFPIVKSESVLLSSSAKCAVYNIKHYNFVSKSDSNSYVFQILFADSILAEVSYLFDVRLEVFNKGRVDTIAIDSLLIPDEMTIISPENVSSIYNKLHDINLKTPHIFIKDKEADKKQYDLLTGFLIPNIQYDSLKMHVGISVISLSYYQYLQNLYYTNSSYYYLENFIFSSNPVTFSNNINNGYGLFGTVSRTSAVVKLPKVNSIVE